MQLELLRRLTVDRAAGDGPHHLAAASGLVAHGDRLFVIGDDETHLAVLSASGTQPAALMRLFGDVLPPEHKARKAAKPDLETLLMLPASISLPHGGLLALGSGSTARRRRGAVLPLDAKATTTVPQVLDLTALFEAIDRAVPETNIEGAIVRDGALILFNRGNRAHPATIAIAFDLSVLTEAAAARLKWEKTIALPDADGVPLSITDACLLDDGAILASAVAEDTSDAYNDGQLAAAAFVLLAPDLTVTALEMIEPAVKIEGVHAWREAGRIHLLAVSDADDPATAAGVYRGTL